MSRRDDPLGRRALFGPPPDTVEGGGAGTSAVAGSGSGSSNGYPTEPESGESGRRALFSGTPVGPKTAAAAGPHLSQVRVACASCGESTAIGLAALAVQLVPSVWVPFRRQSRYMRCPQCRHMAWCRLSWPA